ncbi:MAG: recombinase family protein [Oscillospiraceae bacterium]|nr:recombinase family protein [Oscillospiraceae bacterium]
MNNSPVVTIIPAKVDKHNQPIGEENPRKKRVAAYARVSTDLTEQLLSYTAQVDYYTKHIKENEKWEFVAVYTDEGISATSTKRRDGFNRMIADALSGKIDLILTKSVSRFARNTVDTLTNVRKLKDKGVEVFFEKENIYTMDSKGELLITLMSSLAQEESRSISENVTWGQRKRMADGKVNMPYGRFLGYRKGVDGTPEIVEEEAEVVRRIYSLFLGGLPYRHIAKQLTLEGIKTPGGKPVWSVSTIRSILQNEKYAGRAILQKQFTVDFLTKKQKVNEGEVPQYLVENSHPAIVPLSTYELVQGEIHRRSESDKRLIGRDALSGKVLCGECGNAYGSKVWHSTSPYRKTVWRCNYKYKGDRKCRTPHLSGEEIHSAFICAWNTLLADKSRLIAEYETEIAKLADSSSFDIQTAELKTEYGALVARQKQIIDNSHIAPQNQAEQSREYDRILARADKLRQQIEDIAKEKLWRTTQKERLSRFITLLNRSLTPIAAFDEQLWREAVESITIHSRENIVVRFHSGTEIKVGVE